MRKPGMLPVLRVPNDLVRSRLLIGIFLWAAFSQKTRTAESLIWKVRGLISFSIDYGYLVRMFQGRPLV
jgi:hypothetical protein